MVLTDKEKAGAAKILNLLSSEEILSLARTVTKQQIVIQTSDEAIGAIISYTASPAELLRRRKVRRDVLFKYTHQEQLTARPADEKVVLIQRILMHWGSRSVPLAYLMDTDDDAVSAVVPISTTPRTVTVATPTPQDDRLDLETATRPTQPARNDAYSCWNDRSLHSTDEDQQMALQFAAWFYPLFNASGVNPSDFGTEHFFGDASLVLCVASGGQVGARPTTDRYDGNDLVVRRLTALVADEKLVFNPNVAADGTRGMSDPHGRRVIAICGTVHRADCVLGLFEQQFGLVRDPSAGNNWKIRTTRLLVSTTVPTSRPTLAMTQAMLTNGP